MLHKTLDLKLSVFFTRAEGPVSYSRFCNTPSLEEFCEDGQIEKYRYRIPAGNRVWEIDEFLGKNAGLIMAEIELESPDEPFERPDWLGREVTGEIRFYNSHLLEYPYKMWKEEEKI